MSIKKHGVIVDCEHCVCTSSDCGGAFEITVPVSDSAANISGRARLRCTVSPKRHMVELTEWRDPELHPISLSDDLQQRISATLSFVADRQVCGNRNICPSEVVRIVEGKGGAQLTGDGLTKATAPQN